jgi:hypothetical protein
MSKFPRKLVSNTEPLANVAGMYTTVESLQSFTAATGGMAITAVTITDNTYTALDDTAVNTAGGYIKLTGTGFASGAIAYIGGTTCTTTFTSSTELRVIAPANTAGTLSLAVFNTTDTGAIWAAGLVYSGFPVVNSSYSNFSAVVNTQLVATGDAPLEFTLQGGSTLPTGVNLSSTGLLSGTVTGIFASTVFTFTVLVNDSQLQATQQLITLTVILADTNFNSTVLLLHGDGRDGTSNNNTFKDSSTNNFAITRASAPTQGTFSPFSQTGWSGNFNGSTDALTIPSTSVFAIGTGNFTMECWYYPLTANTVTFFNPSGSNGLQFGYQSATQWGIANSVIGWLVTTTTMPVLNQWNHMVVCRGGTGTNQVSIYLNGIRVAQGTAAAAFSTSMSYTIGSTNLSGYMSNFRVVSLDVYGYTNATITVPTVPLTAISGTSLLTLQSNRFKDNSSNNFAITPTGSPKIQAFSPFAPAAAYSTATVGGSMYFNGTTDYLTIPTNATLTFGSGAGVSTMTAEAWFYTSAAGTDQTVISQYFSGASGWSIRLTTSLLRAALTGDTTPITGTTTLRANTWYHAALSGSAGSWKLFLNGVQEGATQTASVSLGDGAPIQIGRLSNVTYFSGYISNARVVKGTALYTANFTPSTAPLTAITNTVLLLNSTNAAIYDQTAKNDLVTVGSAKTSDTQSKFGGKSIFFNGTTDYLTTIDKPTLQLGTGNFTIEAWVYLTTASTSRGLVSKGPVAGTTGWECKFNSANVFRFEWTASSLVGVATIPITTWTHVAVVRSGSATGNVKLYVNGTLYATSAVAVTDNFTQTDPLRIGIDRVGTGFFPGYVDDLRITKYARYTANFTPPDTTFLDQ